MIKSPCRDCSNREISKEICLKRCKILNDIQEHSKHMSPPFDPYASRFDFFLGDVYGIGMPTAIGRFA